MSDEHLIKELLRRQSRFMGYLLAITRDLDAAEEIFQNVAVIVMERSKSEEKIADFFSWTKEVLRRQALYYMREKGRDKQEVKPLAPRLLEGISRVLEDDQTDEESESRERSALQECLSKLSDKARRLMSLRYERREGFEQIGLRIDSTAMAVQRALSRIRKMLRECVMHALEGSQG